MDSQKKTTSVIANMTKMKSPNQYYAFIFLLFVLILPFSYTYLVTTVAGITPGKYVLETQSTFSTMLNHPFGISVDQNDVVYVADSLNFAIRKISNYIISTVAGNGTAGYSGDGGPAVNATLRQPHGVFVTKTGEIYIADTYNNAIRKVSVDGYITTIAGNRNGSLGYSGDKRPAIEARLYYPY